MRRWLAFALTLLWAATALAAPAIVQRGNNDTSTTATSLTVTFANGTGVGNFVVLGFGSTSGGGAPGGITCSDPSSDAPTSVVALTDQGNGLAVAACAFFTTTAGTKSFTITPTTASQFWGMFAWEISGLTNAVTDQVNTNGAGSGQPSSGSSGTLTNASEAIISIGISGGGGITTGSFTSGGTFNLSSPNGLVGGIDEIVSATTAQTATYSAGAGGTNNALIATFRGQPPVSTHALFTLLGVGASGGGQLSPGFFVATAASTPPGNDSNNGTLAAPFLTLTKCQSAMEAAAPAKQFCYLRAGSGGSYNMTSTLTLSSTDAGQTWQYYPPDGVNTAVLDGGSSACGNGIDMWTVNGANITINGIKFQNAQHLALQLNGNSDLLTNSDIGNNHCSNLTGFDPIVAVNWANTTVTGAKVTHNFFHDCFSHCPAVYAFNTGTSADGTVFDSNFADRCVLSVNDGGCYYADMRNTNVNGGHVTFSNNYAKNCGATNVQCELIYLDDDSSNVTVKQNITGPPNANSPAKFGNFITNGGSCNTFINNIIDLGPSSSQLIMYTTYPPSAGSAINWPTSTAPYWGTCVNTFSNNIVISKYTGSTTTVDPLGASSGGSGFYQGISISCTQMSISNDQYHNYGGGDETSIEGGGPCGDTAAKNGDPSITGYTYTVAANSTARNSPVSFVPGAGGWGPPGFTIPTDGQAPSNPH